VLEARAICETCGHTRDWHDRDAVRARLRSDPPVERPCYREVDGAACLCGGFRESGTLAVPAGALSMRGLAPGSELVRVAALVVLVVFLGLGLLYAYRSQTPAVPEIAVTKALQDINAGQVRSVTIDGPMATLELKDGSKERTTLAQPDTILVRSIADYNAAHPSQQIEIRVQSQNPTVGTTTGIVSLPFLLLVLLIAAFLYYMRSRRRA
jgi:hypothetical protein